MISIQVKGRNIFLFVACSIFLAQMDSERIPYGLPQGILMMQVLFKNLFNLICFLKISLFVKDKDC
jgi:hypothetical protein